MDTTYNLRPCWKVLGPCILLRINTKHILSLGSRLLVKKHYKIARALVTHACLFVFHATKHFQACKPGIQADRLLCFHQLFAISQFWECSTFHCVIADFTSFLLASAPNNPFIMKFVKIWPGGTFFFFLFFFFFASKPNYTPKWKEN